MREGEMEIQDNKVFFSSGKTRYTYKGIIGIDSEMKVTEGYDGDFYSEAEFSEDDDKKLTKDDLLELAGYMIERWEKFKLLHT